MKASKKLQNRLDKIRHDSIVDIKNLNSQYVGGLVVGLEHIVVLSVDDCHFERFTNNYVYLYDRVRQTTLEYELEDFAINDLLFILESIENDIKK